jgi:hypothetical protein
MRCTSLVAVLLGELASPSHAIHYARALESSGDLRATDARGTHRSTLETFSYGGMLGNSLVSFDDLTDKAAARLATRKVSFLQTKDEAVSDEVVDSDDVVASDEDGAHDESLEDLSATTLSPQQRAEAHAQKYLAEFVVELNMTRAHETGKRIGLVTNREADFMPASVWRVQKTGLIQEWNDANPGKDVHVGDEIVRVNDIQWHANTKTFITRINGQFKAARNQMSGTSDILRLYIQRPKHYQEVWNTTRFLGQRVSAHTQDYSKEFSVELPMPENISSLTLDSIMGWKIGGQEEDGKPADWKPAAIHRIAREGAVATWNKAHPDDLILEGDELLKIDNIIQFATQRKSSVFMSRLKQHYINAQKVVAKNRSLLVRIQRPRTVQVAFDEKHPVEEIYTTSRTGYDALLEFRNVSGAENITDEKPKLAEHILDDFLGWRTVPGVESDNGWSGPITVYKVVPGGVVSRLNEEHPNQAIAPFDEILGVNGVSWENYDTPKEFFQKVQSSLGAAARHGGSSTVMLSMARPTETLKYRRSNMENGVHMDCPGCTTTTTEPPPFVADGESPNDAPAPSDQTPADAQKPGDAADDDVIGASED